MALLSIAEPGQSQAPHQHRLAIGIDLGTTNSLVAAVRGGSAAVLPDEDGMRLLPSVVRYLGDGRVEVGYAAKQNQVERPAQYARLGQTPHGTRTGRSPEPQRRAYRLGSASGMVQLQTIAGARSPVEVSAEILKVLRVRAEQSLGGELVGAVITVPAYFDEAQRQATKDAARLAGLQRAAPAQRADRGGDGLRPGACRRRRIRRL